MKLLIEWNAVVGQRIIETTEEDLRMLQEEGKYVFMKVMDNSKISLSTHAENKL